MFSEFKTSLYIGFFLLSVSFGASGQQLSDIYTLREKAKAGDAEASYALGKIYEEGTAEKANPKKAFKYYEEAALKGHEEGQLALANAYRNGYGTAQDAATAFQWYQKLTEKNHPTAIFELGTMYQNGESVEKDENKAIAQFLQAWNYAHPMAESKLKELPLADYTDKNDLVYIAFATKEGLPEGLYASGQRQLQTGNGTKALDYFQRAARKEYLPAQMALGEMYKEGNTIPQNLRLAVKYYLQAALNGEEKAEIALQAIDLEKWGDPDSKEFLEFTANKGIASGQFMLGKKHLTGASTISKDQGLGLEWIQKSALQDYEPAINYLGVLYERGENGIEQNLQTSFKWYRKSAYVGNDSAQYVLGSMYEEGKGTDKDDALAIRWYLKAANAGRKEADIRLSSYSNAGIERYIDAYDLEFVRYRARNGDTDAILLLGKYLVKIDDNNALFWLNKLVNDADHGKEANELLGQIYYLGKSNVQVDAQKASTYFAQAKTQGSIEAHKYMAQMYADSLLSASQPLMMAESEMTAYLQKLQAESPDHEDLWKQYFVLAGWKEKVSDLSGMTNYFGKYQASPSTQGEPQKLLISHMKSGDAFEKLNNPQEAAKQFEQVVAVLEKFQQHPEISRFNGSYKAQALLKQGINLMAFSNLFKACEVLQKARAAGAKIPDDLKQKCIESGE